MIKELMPTLGIEEYLNEKICEDIETEFKRVLDTDKLHYYAYICTNQERERKCVESDHKIKWYGNIPLREFIRRVQKDGRAFDLEVTSLTSKGATHKNNEEHDSYNSSVERKSYWIGDVVKNDMICGDRLFISLWERIRAKVANYKNQEERRQSWYPQLKG